MRSPNRPQPCQVPSTEYRAPRRRTIGYTLIELLIVMAILGISSAILVPHLVNRDSMNVQAAVRLIIGDLSFAQSDALAHQELRRVHFYDDGRGYCLVRITQAELAQPFNEATADYIQDPLDAGTVGNYIVNFLTDTRFHGVSIQSVSIDGNGRNLHYDSLGGTVTNGGGPGTGGSITVVSGTDKYRLDIAPFTGKLTVVKLP